jgi:UDP-N-acetylmuramoyl-tripeptide--D-alanyl-D-alanine ligase
MTLDLRDVARAIGAHGEARQANATGWSVDTRTLAPGDVYFALRGPNHDGHGFVPAALEMGAAAAVVECAQGLAGELVVADAQVALQSLASWARLRWGGQVVGVTGSAGKTTTKDAIAAMLAVESPVGRTMGNFNNHVGVPLSILRLPEGCRAAVLELGMNHPGEIRHLASIARPDVGVVTNVGYAHVEFFEDGIAGVAASKRELIESLGPEGVAVLNADDERVARFAAAHRGRSVTFGFSGGAEVRAQAVEFAPEGTRFRALDVEFETSVTGRHGVLNLLAGLAVARVFSIDPARLRDVVRSFSVGSMRGERLEHGGAVVWNDCYNSNPEAARSMLDVLRATPAQARIAVLGEMLELGRAAGELHSALGQYVAAGGIDLLIGVRGHAREMVEAASRGGVEAKFFDDPEAAGEFARERARPGDALLFKGSRGVQVERALARFLA